MDKDINAVVAHLNKMSKEMVKERTQMKMRKFILPVLVALILIFGVVNVYSDITKCSDYDNEAACENNIFNVGDCKWSTLDGQCIDCDDIASCGDYNKYKPYGNIDHACNGDLCSKRLKCYYSLGECKDCGEISCGDYDLVTCDADPCGMGCVIKVTNLCVSCDEITSCSDFYVTEQDTSCGYKCPEFEGKCEIGGRWDGSEVKKICFTCSDIHSCSDYTDVMGVNENTWDIKYPTLCTLDKCQVSPNGCEIDYPEDAPGRCVEAGGGLKASFTAEPTSGPAPLTVQFTDKSTGNPTSWSWDFGDGKTSTEQNPTHTYDSAGEYTVILTVSDGTDTDSTEQTITVYEDGEFPSVDGVTIEPSEVDNVGDSVVITASISGDTSVIESVEAVIKRPDGGEDEVALTSGSDYSGTYVTAVEGSHSVDIEITKTNGDSRTYANLATFTVGGDGDDDGDDGPTDLDLCIEECMESAPGGEILHLIRYTACIVLRIIQLLGVIASVIAIVLSGIVWLTSDDPKQRNTAKKIFMFALLGLVVIMIVIQLINAFISPAEDITSSIVSIGCETTINESIYKPIVYVGCILYRVLQLGAIVLVSLIVLISGIIWIGSDSPEERKKAKNMAVSAIIGLLIVMIAIHILGSIIDVSIGWTFGCGGEVERFPNILRVSDVSPTIETALRYVGCVGIRIFQILAIMLAVLIIVFSGIRFITSDNPEERVKARNMIVHAIIGFLIVFVGLNLINAILTGPLGFDVIDCTNIDKYPGIIPEEGTSARTELDNIIHQIEFTVCIVIYGVYLTIAIIGALIIALAGVVFLSTDDPVKRNKAKHLVLQTIIGLVIIIIAMHLIKIIATGASINPLEGIPFSNGDTCVDIVRNYAGTGFPGMETITDPINKTVCVIILILQAIIGILLLLVIVFAGFRWLLSDSAEERVRAKRMIIYGIIAIIIVFLATNIIYAIFSSVSTGEISYNFVKPGDWKDACGISEEDVEPITSTIETVGCIIFLLLFFLSGIIFAAIITYAGIKWITSEGAKDRAEAKWILIKAIIGYTIIMIASQLVMMLTSFILTGLGDIGGDSFWDWLWNFFKRLIGKPYIFTCMYDVLKNFNLGEFWLLLQLWYVFCLLVRILEGVAVIAAAIMIAIAGIKWIGSDSPEERKRAKSRILHTIVGLAIVIIAFSLADGLFLFNFIMNLFGLPFTIDLYSFFCPDWATFTSAGGLVLKQLQYVACIIIRGIQGISAMLAAVIIMLSGFIWMKSEDYRERVKARDRILHAIIGLAIVIITLELVNLFIGGSDIHNLKISCDVEVSEITEPINYIGCKLIQIMESLAALVAAILLTIVGYKWMTSEIPEERVKARDRFLAIIVGLIIIILTLELVNVFVSGSEFLSFTCEKVGSIDCKTLSDSDSDYYLKKTICDARYIGCLIIRLLEFLVAVVAGLIILYSGFVWMTSESPGERDRAKRLIINAIIGAAIVLFSLLLINYLVNHYRLLNLDDLIQNIWC